jgi:adenine deaminase
MGQEDKEPYRMISFEPPRRRLAETALGNEPADMVIIDGTLMDVYTGRMLPHRSVAIRDRWIAYVGPDATHTIGSETKVIEAGDRIICPGYMDTHTHIAGHWDLSDFLRYAIPGGTTTFITEVESFGLAMGAKGFRAFLDQVHNRPVKIFCLVPPMVTISPAITPLYITPDEARELFKEDWVIGLGESYWQNPILISDDRVLDLIQEAGRAGKTVQGHAAGAFDRKLASYAAIGALSCHEAVSTDDILSRLELGYYVMIREGYIRRDLEAILPIKDSIDLRRLILVTDGADPELLIKQGYFVDVIQKAVDLGLEPVRAVQMVTINPAEHFGLDHIIGGISPGRLADILLLPDSDVMRPDLVISHGQIVAENGKTLVPLPKVPYAAHLAKTVRISPVSASQLRVPMAASSPNEFIRTMDIQPGGLVTREGSGKALIINGEYCPDPENDLLKIVFIERVSGKGEKFVGFVRGWGQKKGAVATSLCWDATGIVAIGSNDEDIALCINRVIENQGGTSLSVHGILLVDIPFRIVGYISQMKIEDLVRELKHFQNTVSELGSTLQSAHLTLATLTSAAIPFIRIAEKGYYRFRESDVAGL